MARSSGFKRRKSAIGGEFLGVYIDGLGRRSNRYGRLYTNDEMIISSNHRGPPYRSGGPMFLTRTKYSYTLSDKIVTYCGGGINGYEGRMETAYVPMAMPLPTIPSLTSLGTEAISRTIPTSPSASLAVFLGELRDFPGMITQTRKFFHDLVKGGVKLHRGNVTVGEALEHFSDPRRPAGDYLNLQFGWLPFLRDLQSFYKTGESLDERVAFLRRNNMGKPVVRSRVLRQWDDSSLVDYNENYTLGATLTPAIYSFLYWASGIRSTTRRTVQQYGKIWFKATYSYYSPEIASMPDWQIKADLLGLRLDPAVIYQLVPWTWLLDWFTTAGALVTNAVELSGHHVVLHHGYVMCHMRSTHKHEATQEMKTGYVACSNNPAYYGRTNLKASATCLFETKQRVAANPYGFEVNWDSLTGYQLSILAALGISRRSRDQ